MNGKIKLRFSKNWSQNCLHPRFSVLFLWTSLQRESIKCMNSGRISWLWIPIQIFEFLAILPWLRMIIISQLCTTCAELCKWINHKPTVSYAIYSLSCWRSRDSSECKGDYVKSILHCLFHRSKRSVKCTVHMSFSTCILQNKQSAWCAFDANLELQFYPR